jgi:hypothetical protein
MFPKVAKVAKMSRFFTVKNVTIQRHENIIIRNIYRLRNILKNVSKMFPKVAKVAKKVAKKRL